MNRAHHDAPDKFAHHKKTLVIAHCGAWRAYFSPSREWSSTVVACVSFTVRVGSYGTVVRPRFPRNAPSVGGAFAYSVPFAPSFTLPTKRGSPPLTLFCKFLELFPRNEIPEKPIER